MSKKRFGEERAGCLLAFSMLVVVATGCTTFEESQSQVEQVVRDWRRPSARMDSTDDAASLANESRASEASQFESAIARRPVDAYIREALERNPGIQAAMANARAQLERIPQVTSLPDPVLRSVVRPEPIQTAAGDIYFTLGVSQTFPLLAKLDRAGNIAAAQTRAALEDLGYKRVRLIADVERAYWQIYRLDRYLEITRENLRVLEDLEGVVETRYEVGKVPQQDLLRTQTEVAKLRDDEHRINLQRLTAAAALNQLADQPSQRDIPTTSPVELGVVRADVDELVKLAAENNPELAMLEEQIQANREKIELANLGYWPDLTLGFEWNHLDGRGPFIPPVNPITGARPPINRKSEAGDDNWAITLQINLPIWTQRIEAARREARQRFLSAQRERQDAENMIAFRIFDAWSRVEAQQHTLRVLGAELIPQSRQTYEVALIAYQSGDTDFVALIDHWRRWLDFELMRHRETVDLEVAFAELQREVGLQLIRGDVHPQEETGINP